MVNNPYIFAILLTINRIFCVSWSLFLCHVSRTLRQGCIIRSFENSAVARCSLAVSSGQKSSKDVLNTAALIIKIEILRRSRINETFDFLKKSNHITIEGSSKPGKWATRELTRGVTTVCLSLPNGPCMMSILALLTAKITESLKILYIDI